jgi:hypothetical protein
MSRKEDMKIIGWDGLVGVYEIGIIPYKETKGTLTSEHEGHIKYEIEAGKEAAMRFSLIAKQFKHLMGDVLTTLEATIDDNRKLEATKKIIKNQVHSKVNWVYEQCGCPEEEQDYLMLNDPSNILE